MQASGECACPTNRASLPGPLPLRDSSVILLELGLLRPGSGSGPTRSQAALPVAVAAELLAQAVQVALAVPEPGTRTKTLWHWQPAACRA
jgi:hypothetical protein